MSVNELKIPFAYAPNVLAVNVVIITFSIIAVGTRFGLRLRHPNGIGADDWLTFGALLFVLGMSISQIYGVAKHAVGYASQEYATPIEELTSLTPEQRLVELIYWITWLLMVPANGLIKLSALFLYRRLFLVDHASRYNIFSKVMIAICTAWTIAFFFAILFGCGKHFNYPWGPLIEVGSCATNIRVEALMISDLITDVIVWVIPVPIIFSLSISVYRRLAIIGIFMLAAVSIGAAIVRLIIQDEITNGGYAASTNVDLTLTNNIYWSMIESGLALIAGCLPTMQLTHAVRSISTKLSSLRSGSRAQNSSKSTGNISGPSHSYMKKTTRDTKMGGDSVHSLTHMSDASHYIELEEGPKESYSRDVPAVPNMDRVYVHKFQGREF